MKYLPKLVLPILRELRRTFESELKSPVGKANLYLIFIGGLIAFATLDKHFYQGLLLFWVFSVLLCYLTETRRVFP
jgi:hypothetical protein